MDITPIPPHNQGTNPGESEEQTLFDAVGGDQFFQKLVHGFYSQVKNDDLIGPMYPNQDWEGAENRLRWFLAQYWGGPRTYQQERGNPMLRRRHFAFPIGVPEAERWLEMMETSLDQFSEDELAPAYRAALWNHMQRVAYMMINQGPHANLGAFPAG